MNSLPDVDVCSGCRHTQGGRDKVAQGRERERTQRSQPIGWLRKLGVPRRPHWAQEGGSMLTGNFTACEWLMAADQIHLLLGEGLDVLWGESIGGEG